MDVIYFIEHEFEATSTHARFEILNFSKKKSSPAFRVVYVKIMNMNNVHINGSIWFS